MPVNQEQFDNQENMPEKKSIFNTSKKLFTNDNKVSVKWDEFLSSLYDKFSKYEIQKDRKKYNVANIEDWGKDGKPQGIIINRNNFKTFLKKVEKYNVTEFDHVKNMDTDTLQLEELNHVLDLTLKRRLNISCKEPNIFIKGDFISVQDIVKNIKDNVDVDNCGDFLKILNPEKFKFINVFALNTVFIDEDISFQGLRLPVTVIAPKWEVIGSRQITLNGIEGGSDYDYKVVSISPSVKVETKSEAAGTANMGKNGKVGKPGGPGGVLFGIGDEFINGTNLTITANGGAGGSGQNGGNGRNGRNGVNPVAPSASDTSCKDNLCDGGKINGFKCEKIDCKYRRRVIVAPNWAVTDLDYCSYKIFGEPGKKGEEGGDGGKGGKGGYPGNVLLFELNNYSGIRNVANVGSDGENGKGAKGGIGGINGNDIIVKCWAPMWNIFRFKTSWSTENTIQNGKNPPGKNGSNQNNAKNPEKPEKADVTLEPAAIVNHYKVYLRENLDDPIKEKSLIQFLLKLDNDENVKNAYGTIDLFNELKTLEEQFHAINRNVHISYFYQSLLNRISKYAQKPRDAEKSIQHKKALNYLYTATLGRMYNLEDDTKFNLIIDISKYLDLIEEDIKILKDMQDANNKASIVNKHKGKYKSSLNKKIKEARDFIKNLITPEIESIDTDIDDKIDLLIEEVLTLQKQSREKILDLNKKKKELQDALVLRKLFDFLKIFAQVADLLSPASATATSVVELVNTVAESLVLDRQDDKKSDLPPNIKSDLQLLDDQIENTKNQKIIHLIELTKYFLEETNKDPESLSGLTEKVLLIQEKLNKVKDTFDFSRVQALENELKKELKIKEEELKSKKDSFSEKNKTAIELLESILGAIAFRNYDKYKNDSVKRDTINDAIKEAESELEELKQFEDTIYNIIIPMLRDMDDALKSIANKVENESQVALDVSKWQVQSTLRDMKVQIQQLMKRVTDEHFEMKDNLLRSIDKLEEAMEILINVYNYIQKYQKEQNWVDYISDISSTTASSIHIDNAELTNVVNELEVKIRSNIILKQYQTAMNAFKQWVFPFIELYLDNSLLPSHLKLDDNLENLVSEAITQISNIRLKIKQHKNSIEEEDKALGKGNFDSQTISTKAFFTWKKEEYKNKISQLLSGKEVILHADVTKSASDKYAIKFNLIGLNFKSQNQTMQSKIQDILRGFEVSAIHLGNSYYIYDNKTYLITSDSQTIEFYFDKNPDGSPVHVGGVYDKLKNGDFMLSPYATWKIMLYNLENECNYNFNDLEIFRNITDLELTGYGYYIKKRAIGDLNLSVEKYYKTIDEMYEDNPNPEFMKINSIVSVPEREFVKQKRSVNETKNKIDQANQAKIQRKENNHNKEHIWFSWLKLPNFNILPGADAFVVDDGTLENPTDNSVLDIITPFINSAKQIKNLITSKLPKLPTDDTKTLEENYCTNYIQGICAMNSSKHLAIDFNDSTHDNVQSAMSTVNINNSLILGHLIVHKILGRNCFKDIQYESPEEEQYTRINKLAAEILPIPEDKFNHDYANDFIAKYDQQPQWYKDMYRVQHDHIIKKNFFKTNGKVSYEDYTPEAIFADSLDMFCETTEED